MEDTDCVDSKHQIWLPEIVDGERIASGISIGCDIQSDGAMLMKVEPGEEKIDLLKCEFIKTEIKQEVSDERAVISDRKEKFDADEIKKEQFPVEDKTVVRSDDQMCEFSSESGKVPNNPLEVKEKLTYQVCNVQSDRTDSFEQHVKDASEIRNCMGSHFLSHLLVEDPAQITKSQSEEYNKESKPQDSVQIMMYKCTECNYECQQNGDLQNHMQLHTNSSQSEMFKCTECKYKCKRMDSLQRHIQGHIDNPKIKVFKCTDCSYQSKRSAHLQKHLLSHKDPSQITMFKCNECSYEFKRKGDLRKHIVVHQDPSQITMFKCDQCNYQSKRKRNLQDHLLVHQDQSRLKMFNCPECSYQCKRKSNLQNHMLIHKDASEVKMFVCKECGYQCKQNGNLQRHKLVHQDPSQGKKFKCTECSYQCQQKSNLQSHMRVHRVRFKL